MKAYKEEPTPSKEMIILAMGVTLSVAGFAIWVISAAAQRGLL